MPQRAGWTSARRACASSERLSPAVRPARLLRQRGETQGALDRLERTLRIAPGLCEAHIERIEMLEALGRPRDQARAELKRVCTSPEVVGAPEGPGSEG
jgi:hypothetical protein